MANLIFIVELAEEGGYNARAETESIYTQAETLEELNLNIEDAIKCHFGDEAFPGFRLKFVWILMWSLNKIGICLDEVYWPGFYFEYF